MSFFILFYFSFESEDSLPSTLLLEQLDLPLQQLFFFFFLPLSANSVGDFAFKKDSAAYPIDSEAIKQDVNNSFFLVDN